QRPDHMAVNTTLRSQMKPIVFRMPTDTDARLTGEPGASKLPARGAFMYNGQTIYAPKPDEVINLTPAQIAPRPFWLRPSPKNQQDRGQERGQERQKSVAVSRENPSVLGKNKNSKNGKNGVPPYIQTAAKAALMAMSKLPDTVTPRQALQVAMMLQGGASQNQILRDVFGQRPGSEGGRQRDYVKIIQKELKEANHVTGYHQANNSVFA
ncbi:MAG: hypothetical protein D6706_21020, partial [Chloroflexi bacterium]